MSFRINSPSLRQALINYYIMEKRGYKGIIGISSRNLIFLDVDGKDEEQKQELISVLNAIVKIIAENSQYAIKCTGKIIIYETNGGLHGIITIPLTRFLWMKIYNFLSKEIHEGRIKYIDVRHVDFSIKRGYTTLRLNHIAKLYEKDVEVCSQHGE